MSLNNIICTTCGYDVEKQKSLKIEEGFINYNTKSISYGEIIQKLLDFRATNENCSMQICKLCKIKLEDFYNFRMRSEELRGIQYEFLQESIFLENYNPVISIEEEEVDEMEVVDEYFEEFIDEVEINELTCEDESTNSERGNLQALSNKKLLKSKRSRYPDEWKCNKRKKLRNSGQSC